MWTDEQIDKLSFQELKREIAKFVFGETLGFSVDDLIYHLTQEFRKSSDHCYLVMVQGDMTLSWSVQIWWGHHDGHHLLIESKYQNFMVALYRTAFKWLLGHDYQAPNMGEEED